MTRAHYRPETDGFAFTNDWTFDTTETATLTQLVTDAVDVIEIVLAPLILVAEGPVLAVEAGVPFIGPWLVAKTIEAENNAIVNGIVQAITAGHYGLCGGMAFASLDYWLKGWVVPCGINANDQPQRTSPTGTALRNYIWGRLLQSVKDNVGTFLQWMAVLHFEGGPGATWLRDQTKSELVKLKARIKGGTPVTVGLVGTTWNPLFNHQVLVYGFNDNPDETTTLFVYDNNHPGVETTYRMDFSGPELQVAESQKFGDRGPMKGLFCTTYAPATPPRTVVLRTGLTVSPAVTGLGDPVNVQMTIANIGFHASPAMSLVIAGDAGAAVQEVALTTLAEGGTRSLAGHLAFPGAGNHKIGVIASLGTVMGTGMAITKFLPPETSAQLPSGSVVIVGERLIDADAQTICQVSNMAGEVGRFSVRVDDMGTGLSFAWTATGALIVSGATSQEVQVQLPAQPGASVTLSVTVKRPDGGLSTGSYTFATITSMAAALEQMICEISHVITQPPFQTKPGDPGPDRGRIANPGDIATLAAAAAQLSQAANAAVKAGTAVTLSPVARLSLALQPAIATPVGLPTAVGNVAARLAP
jgi:hypothetical protein